MNLIEQLGGYEKAKEYLLNLTSADNDAYSWSRLIQANNIKQELLEYRRQHNIFEVGDYVLRKDGFSNVLKITAVDEVHADLIRRVDGEPRWCRFKLADICHATDAEIHAGKRL